VKDVLRLLLLTAQRPGEVMGMRWDEIDFEESLWSIPAWRTKPRRATVVPISAQAMRIIQRRRDEIEKVRTKRQHKGDPAPLTAFVFPNRHLAKYDKEPIKMTRKMVERVINKVSIERFTPHDLRRTCATNLGKMEVPGLVIDLILNHAPKGVTNTTYNRYDYLKERREALDRWGLRVHQIVTGLRLANRGGTSQA
jgi:integrase